MSIATNICLIYGSAREGRFCDTVAGWAHHELDRRGDFRVSIVDPLDGRSSGERNATLAEADAFIVVTPEYNHSFPAPLKTIIDGAKSEWEAKPVAFVSYGGISGGLRAVEQLRTVFAELHAVSVRDQVSIAFAGRAFDEAGRPRDAQGVGEAFAVMLDRLVWWSDALAQVRGCCRFVRAPRWSPQIVSGKARVAGRG
ncbi:NADPH-dependent FMN reductase [Salinisphaera aquimarina]|uniref:NADPH-dependent FMN reductase n=1 Tax=Salinisphaera aquimarina TaxID=2094031 RepID=A0ABV7EJ85_9GAMM